MKKGCDKVIYMLCQQNGVQIGELIFLAGSRGTQWKDSFSQFTIAHLTIKSSLKTNLIVNLPTITVCVAQLGINSYLRRIGRRTKVIANNESKRSVGIFSLIFSYRKEDKLKEAYVLGLRVRWYFF